MNKAKKTKIDVSEGDILIRPLVEDGFFGGYVVAFATEIERSQIVAADPQMALERFLKIHEHPAATGFSRNWISTQIGGFGGCADRKELSDILDNIFSDIRSADDLVEDGETWWKKVKRSKRAQHGAKQAR